MRRLLILLLLTGFLSPLPAQDPEPEHAKTLMFYTPGFYTLFGVRLGMQAPSGWGLYLDGRFNMAAFTANEYTITDGRINDGYWKWEYAGKKKYARNEMYAGIMFPVLPKENPFDFSQKFHLTMWAGCGILYARYLYLFDRTYQQQLEIPTWVRDLDQGGVGFDVEAGLQLRRGRTYFFLGCSGLMHETERMPVAGIGYKYR